MVELDPTGFEDAQAQLEVDMLQRALVQVKLKPFTNSPKEDSVKLRRTLVEKSVSEIDALWQRQQNPAPHIVLLTVILSMAPPATPSGQMPSRV